MSAIVPMHVCNGTIACHRDMVLRIAPKYMSHMYNGMVPIHVTMPTLYVHRYIRIWHGINACHTLHAAYIVSLAIVLLTPWYVTPI